MKVTRNWSQETGWERDANNSKVGALRGSGIEKKKRMKQFSPVALTLLSDSPLGT